MNWTLYILLSAVFLAFYDIAKKASVRDNAVLPTLLISSTCGCIAFFIAIASSGNLANILAMTSPRVLLFASSKSIIVATSWIFTFCALRTLPISIATPIRASAPALTFLLAICLYNEIPGFLQAIGMLTIFSGYFVFSWAGRHEGIDFFRNRAVWCAIAGAVFSAISAIWDKYVFQVATAPIEAVQLFFQLGLVLFYAIALLATKLFASRQRKFEWRWSIPFVGTLLMVADWLYFHGIAIDGTPITDAALMRRFSVVITFVLGAKFFHETNLLRKALALTAIVIGVILLAIK